MNRCPLCSGRMVLDEVHDEGQRWVCANYPPAPGMVSDTRPMPDRPCRGHRNIGGTVDRPSTGTISKPKVRSLDDQFARGWRGIP